jgi:hypothetical protein
VSPSIFKLIRKVEALARVLPTFVFSLAENTYDERLKTKVEESRHLTYTLGVGTSFFNHWMCFDLIRCAKKVSKLINHPVVYLFGTRMGGTRVKVVT